MSYASCTASARVSAPRLFCRLTICKPVMPSTPMPMTNTATSNSIIEKPRAPVLHVKYDSSWIAVQYSDSRFARRDAPDRAERDLTADVLAGVAQIESAGRSGRQQHAARTERQRGQRH